MTNSQRTNIVLLEESSGEVAQIRMEDGDIFFIAIPEAARACRAFDKAKQFGPQFRELVLVLRDWTQANRTRISSASLTIRDRDILFVVVQKSVEFDEELSASLTQLDLEIANKVSLDLIDLEVMAIPDVSARSRTAFLASGEMPIDA